MKKGLTITMIFEAESANYGESMGNITALKKMSRSDGNLYTYISRQAMRYNIVQQMGVDNTPVSGEKGTVQFSDAAEIDRYPEIDFFGYMKTRAKGSKGADDGGGAATRSAACRLSNAISVEPFHSDLDFLTNMGLAKRGDANGKEIQNNIAQSEIHHALYCYTISIDLDRIGIDAGIEIPQTEKAARVCSLLETVQFLYRDIKGRRENLAPVFVIGGIYERKSPYFEGRCKLEKNKLNCAMLKQVMNGSEDTRTNTLAGYLDGIFANRTELAEAFGKTSVEEVFSKLKAEVTAVYD